MRQLLASVAARASARRLRRLTRRGSATALVAVVVGLATAPSAVAQQPFAGQTIDGPNPAITSLGNVALARDGGGALVYLRAVAGVAHVFASVEAAGVWQAPQQLDGALAGAASQPLIAAANGGRVAAVFISAGTLYGVVHSPGETGFGMPQPLVQGASDPALAISTFGTAYASFTAPNGGVSGVYVARLDRASATWGVITQPLNLIATDNAGFSAATRSALAVASDGQALVAWGESESDANTHVIARRVSASGPSNEPTDLNLSTFGGLAGGSADSPTVGLEDASDFGWVAFRQTFTQGAAQISRTVARHQYGSQFDPPEPLASGFVSTGPTAIDPLVIPTADGADDPQLTIDGDGDGFASVETTITHQVFGDPLSGGSFKGPIRLDAVTNQIPPQPVAALGGIGPLGAVAWLQSTGPTVPTSVLERAYNGQVFAPAAVISAPSLGAVQTGAGALSAAADHYGDSFVAFLQGAPASTRVVVGGVAEPPGPFTVVTSGHTTQRRPTIGWTVASDALGISDYQVQIDGIAVGTTTATHLALASALAIGPHSVRVIAVNHYGVTTTSPSATLVVTHAAKVKRGPTTTSAAP